MSRSTLSHADLEGLLLKRYPTPEWVTLIEVRASTGFSHSGSDQRFDGVALNCYPSKGFLRAAFEIKRSRNDFMKELENPEKRKQAETYYHESWFVCLPKVCDVSEIPEGWGLLVPTKKGDKLIRKRAAKQRKPKDLHDGMVMSMLRQQQYTIDQYRQKEQHKVTKLFKGEVVTEAELEKIVHDRTYDTRDALKVLQNKAIEATTNAEQLRADMQLPFKHLARLARRFGHFFPDGAPTIEHVDELLTEAVAGKLKDARHAIEASHKHLGALLDKISE